MPKTKVDTKLKQRHDPLHVELSHEGGILRSHAKAKTQRKKRDDDDDEKEAFVEASMSRKILKIAKQQQDEITDEDRENRKKSVPLLADLVDEETLGDLQFEDEEDEYEDEDFEEYNEIDELEIDPEEDALFNRFMGVQQEEGTVVLNLADKIMEKIREKEQMEQGGFHSRQEEEQQQGVMLPPKVIEVYTRVGELLSRYRSGKLPKAFKILPSLRNWQDVLYVTLPQSWSTQAVYEATKLFVSGLKAQQSQKFITEVLLERFRDDIQANKSLNYHLYRSLKKSLYKPATFFKGFLFPLCESGTCTLKEAVIAGSVLSKVSIPALHSAAALLKLSEMDYSGPNSLFIKILLDKKYALPYKVVDAIVFHFVRFRANETPLPVVWHQSFLVFAQRYKDDVTEDQRDALMAVLKTQNHPSITPEIRRELLTGATRQLSTQMDLS
jgi:essential nuclear protein 1